MTLPHLKDQRHYQFVAVNSTALYLEQGHRRILLEKPTGTGKTHTAGLILNDPRIRKLLGVQGDRPLKVVWVAHLNRLLTQAEKELAWGNTDIHYQMASRAIPQDLLDNGWDITVIDEAHHEAMMTIQNQLESITTAPILGLTATGDRPDQSLIKFSATVSPISRDEAVKQGFLAESIVRSIVDYATNKEKANSVKSVISQYGHEMQQTLVFLHTKALAADVHRHIKSMGYKSCLCIDQNNAEVERDLNKFSAGEVQFIVSCKKLGEGIDLKGCTDVVLGKRYGSATDLNQTIGRAARPDSVCRIWEFKDPTHHSLDATDIVGQPIDHKLCFKRGGEWHELDLLAD